MYSRFIRETQYPHLSRPFHRAQFAYNLPPHVQTSWGWQNVGYCTPHTDILELDELYLLEIALPGVVLDDVELKIEENCLTVIAKRTPAMFEERAQIIRKELPAGYLVRQFEFDTPILHEQVEARMDRGILFVSVPKVEAALRIPVSVGTIESSLPSMKTRVSKTSEAMRTGKEVAVK